MDWTQLLLMHGYKPIVELGSEYALPLVICWRCPDGFKREQHDCIKMLRDQMSDPEYSGPVEVR